MFELVESHDWDDLPEDPQDAFVKLAELCTRRMNKLIDEKTNGDFDQNIRLQFMTVLSAAAEELEISGCRFVSTHEFSWPEFAKFEQDVRATVTRVRLRKRGGSGDLVAVTSTTRSDLLQHLNRLRVGVTTADLDESSKRKALSKLAEIETEIVSGRVRFTATVATLSIVSALVMSAVSATADFPSALTNMTSLLGIAKLEADAERARIEAAKAPLLLPKSQDLDDEIPF